MTACLAFTQTVLCMELDRKVTFFATLNSRIPCTNEKSRIVRNILPVFIAIADMNDCIKIEQERIVFFALC